MNYIVFDLELNQGFNFTKGKSTAIKSSCPFEIIHLGAVKLNENLDFIGNFNYFIKPKIYTRLHPVVKKLTGIKKSEIKNAKPFREVFKLFMDFSGSDGVLCVWGTSDIKELIRNAEYHKLDASLIPDKYIDIQKYANKALNQPSGTSVGLGNAIRLLELPSELSFHNAFNDAYYTAQVFKKIYTNDITPEIYSAYRTKTRDNSWKTSLDTEGLIKQFEKMFDRKMTLDEQNIIKLAYKMGYTKQFQRLDSSNENGSNK